MTFSPKDHLIQLKGKDYLEVKWRLVWFRDCCPQGTIETELVHLELDRDVQMEDLVWNPQTRQKEKVLKTAKGLAVFRATVKDGKGGVATGTKSESAVNFADFIEKAESGSIGRALAALGYGTQFTGDELDEQARIVDSPVESTSKPDKQPAKQEASPAPTVEQIKKAVEAAALRTKTGALFTFPMLVSHAYQDAIKAKTETVDSLMLRVEKFLPEQRQHLMKVWRDLQTKAKEAA